MKNISLYFQLHQPFRLDPNGHDAYWDDKNKEIFLKVCETSYLPSIRMFNLLIKENPKFKITLSMSGTFIKQAELYNKEIIAELHSLYKYGATTNQVEFLEETFFHSLSSLYYDGEKKEFKDQVTLHRIKMKEVFGAKPTCFRNSELIYNTEIGNTVSQMGFKSIIIDLPLNFKEQHESVYKLEFENSKLLLITRERFLSDQIQFHFKRDNINVDFVYGQIASINKESIVLGMNLEHIGEHIKGEDQIFDFWKSFILRGCSSTNICFNTISDITSKYDKTSLPSLDILPENTTSWSINNNLSYWLGSDIQKRLFSDLEELGKTAKKTRGDFLEKWRNLNTTDNFYYLYEKKDSLPHLVNYYSPYNSISTSTYLMTKNIERLKNNIHSFNIIREKEEIPIIIISPETAKLPETGMGTLAKFVSAKSGGLGEVISALCKGLSERNIKTHLITLDLAKRFKEESNLSEEEWSQMFWNLDPENIHLISSSYFEEKRSAYEGSTLFTSAEFQKQIVNHTIGKFLDSWNLS